MTAADASPGSDGGNPRLLMVFLDGVGIGERDRASNPFAAALGDLPTFGRLLGSYMFTRKARALTGRTALGTGGGLDAALGVAGTPQSATGQTALLTGLNAPMMVGAHERSHPTPELAAMLGRASLLKRLTRAGLRVTFANTYTPAYFDLVRQGKRKHSATTLATLAAGLPLRGMADLLRGDGVYQDFTNEALRQRGYEAPIVEPEVAGKRLAAIASDHDMTLYEYFLTDVAGHSGRMARAVAVLRMLDRFLGAALLGFAEVPGKGEGFGGGVERGPGPGPGPGPGRPRCLLVVSDHGNVEDMGTRLHTTAPAMVACVGDPLVAVMRHAASILDVAPAVVTLLAAGSSAGGGAGGRLAAEK